MRHIMLVTLLGGLACGQTMVEHAAAAAGGSVGGVAGKTVSDGVTTIFNKVKQQSATAAQTEVVKPEKIEAKAGPKEKPQQSAPSSADPGSGGSSGVAKDVTGSVPPPPPAKRIAAVHKPAPPAPKPDPQPEAVPVPPPPPPEVTAEDLTKVATGMNREELLQLGAPSSRISMFEDGHLLEVYRYMAKDTTFGVVRLTDGAVSAVEVR